MGKNSQRRRGPGTFSAAERTAALNAQAAGDGRNPTKVRTAFLAQPIRIGAITIPLFTGGIALILEEIESPLAKPGAGQPTNLQVFEALFAITRPAAEVLSVRAQGAAAWRSAVFTFAETIPLSDIPALGGALGRQLSLAESTVTGSSGKNSPASSGEGAGAGSVSKKNEAQAPVTSRGAAETLSERSESNGRVSHQNSLPNPTG